MIAFFLKSFCISLKEYKPSFKPSLLFDNGKNSFAITLCLNKNILEFDLTSKLLKINKINEILDYKDNIVTAGRIADSNGNLSQYPTFVQGGNVVNPDSIKYNFDNPVIGLGSCIFIHLTKDYKPTAGCIGLKEKDFLIIAA